MRIEASSSFEVTDNSLDGANFRLAPEAIVPGAPLAARFAGVAARASSRQGSAGVSHGATDVTIRQVQSPAAQGRETRLVGQPRGSGEAGEPGTSVAGLAQATRRHGWNQSQEAAGPGATSSRRDRAQAADRMATGLPFESAPRADQRPSMGESQAHAATDFDRCVERVQRLLAQLADSADRSSAPPPNRISRPDPSPLRSASIPRRAGDERPPCSAMAVSTWVEVTTREMNSAWGRRDAGAIGSPSDAAGPDSDGDALTQSTRNGDAGGPPGSNRALPQDYRETVRVDSRPLGAEMIKASLRGTLKRLGADGACQARWVEAALASPVDARYFHQFLGRAETALAGGINANRAARAALAGLLEQIVAGGAASFADYASRAREALGYCGDRITLGLNSMLVGQLEQDIARGAYDADPPALDKALRSLYRFEALRVAAEEKILEDIVDDGAGLRYKDEPVEVHLALQYHLGPKLGLPALVLKLLHPGYVRLRQADYDAIECKVRESEERDYGVYLAAESPHWLDVMSRVDPAGLAAAQDLRHELLQDRFDTDVQAYREAHPAQTREQACVEVSKAQAWRAYAPLMQKHFAPHGLWPLSRTSSAP